ncbi:hypothetical protein [Bradyrhizobium sp. CCBAU 53415]|uniref:hypothetical protein n=1 Tax=Bradyrhizobium sp. CCBAU 53415 TaxID=1325119 RepID=UPI00230609AB|nr:hypothetical protein [Bradyrhizobium sp. CCBAU 53415]MDA9464785.1 hypothetical protein [Bradyrhizobium sp. CCBAU 53415]
MTFGSSITLECRPARLLDLSEDRLDDLLPEPIAASPPERLHEEITADYNDMIYGATREKIETGRKAYARDNAAPARRSVSLLTGSISRLAKPLPVDR